MPGPKGYSFVQIALHWLVALLILAQFLFSDPISEAFRKTLRGETVPFDPVVMSHVAGGVAILALAIWRLMLRSSRGVPAAPEDSAPHEEFLAKLTHNGLYLLLFLLPISGAVAWFGGVDSAGEAHELLKVALLVLVGLHVVAALYHQFWLKDGLLLRMKRPLD